MTTKRRQARLTVQRLVKEAQAMTAEEGLLLLQRNAQLEAYNAELMKRIENMLAKERRLEDALRRSEYADPYDGRAHAACASCGGLDPQEFGDESDGEWTPPGMRVGHTEICPVGKAHEEARR